MYKEVTRQNIKIIIYRWAEESEEVDSVDNDQPVEDDDKIDRDSWEDLAPTDSNRVVFFKFYQCGTK